MEEFTPPPVGTIVSADITSENAEGLRDFYSAVMGWQASPMPMGDYDDYVMMSADGTGWGGGICHLRGVNANQPANQWIVYFRVDNLDQSIEEVTSRNGKVVGDVRESGPGSRFAIIEDPSGAKVALIEFQQP